VLSKQSRGLQCFRRADAWLDVHPEVIPASGSSAEALAKQASALKGVISRMTEHGTEQFTQRDQALLVAKDETTLRSELRKRHMKAIVTVATALRGEVPGIGVLRMPPGGIRSEALVKAAESMSTTVAIYEQVLIEQGLPQDFHAQLVAATSALRASVDARGLAMGQRVGATAGVAADFASGRKILSMIDAVLLHALKADSSTLASWRQVRRITIKPVMPRPSDALSSGADALSSGADGLSSGADGLSASVSVPLAVDGSMHASAPAANAPGSTNATPAPLAA